jgi:REP element-mobilizing transposase RayT
MPRRKLQFAPGQYYHIYNRGAGRQSIFHEDRNYLYVLDLLAQVAAECDVSVIVYCLLPNHYHWTLRQDGDTPAGLVPKRVFGSYSQAFNKAYNRSGTLFEGPYHAIHVESDEYLRHLCRYIHANPVRHGIATDVELWPYSNYLEWIGKRGGELVDRAFVQAHFASAEEYQAYVQSLITGQVKLPKGLQTYLDELEDE